MSDSKVSKDFSSSKYSDQNLSTKAGEILKNMTGNAAFTKPSPTLEELEAVINTYNSSLIAAANGSKADTVIKNNNRAVLEKTLKQEADYVQTASNGDEAIILSSGFDVNKKATTVGPLPKPTNFSVKPGTNRGTLVCSCDAVAGAYVYEIDYTEAPATSASVWLNKVSTKRTATLDLVSGKQYTIRMTAVGADPTRNWSDDLTSFVL